MIAILKRLLTITRGKNPNLHYNLLVLCSHGDNSGMQVANLMMSTNKTRQRHASRSRSPGSLANTDCESNPTCAYPERPWSNECHRFDP